jgi:class 3 adenylate cyclase
VPWREIRHAWSFALRAGPAEFWPLISDTERFNKDCGFPPFETRPPAPGEASTPGVRRLRATYLGIVGEWEEREFEWVEPVRFTVDRAFTRGPLARMALSCSLSAAPSGGTALTYEVRVAPRNLLGALLARVAVGYGMRRDVARVVKAYDRAAAKGLHAGAQAQQGAPGAIPPRIQSIAAALVNGARQPRDLVGRLCDYVGSADDLSASKMRPYALADRWGTDRRETLDLFLHATRAGMLDLSWEVLCPHCRGSKQGRSELAQVGSEAHCDSCGIDFTVNFDQSVELTFVPNPAVRKVERVEYCVGGPQVTPHVVAQRHLAPGESLFVAISYPEGRYRVRTQGIEIQQAFRIGSGGAASVRIDAGSSALPLGEPVAAPGGVLSIVNIGDRGRLVVIERVAWSDQAVSASAVTSRQIFRDLFSREVLRQGERISVGVITIVFTDLKNSTRLYREIGDAPAFGRVLGHFDTLKAAIADGGGAVVKTMGDAVMASFSSPANALSALRSAQAKLADPGPEGHAFSLKCSIHQGPCLAISQNERMDYFGTTVNVGARLCALSTGSDIVISDDVRRDPAVDAAVSQLATKRDASTLRGLDGEEFQYWRVTG